MSIHPKAKDIQRLPGHVDSWACPRLAFEKYTSNPNVKPILFLSDFESYIKSKLLTDVYNLEIGDSVLVVDGSDRFGRVIMNRTHTHEIEFINGMVEEIDHKHLLPLEHPTVLLTDKPTLTSK